MMSAIFNGANLSLSKFDGANVQGASFKDARFVGANLTGLIGWREANFEGACASNSTLLPLGLHLSDCE